MPGRPLRPLTRLAGEVHVAGLELIRRNQTLTPKPVEQTGIEPCPPVLHQKGGVSTCLRNGKNMEVPRQLTKIVQAAKPARLDQGLVSG